MKCGAKNWAGAPAPSAGSVAGLYESFSLPTLFGAVTVTALFFCVVMALLIKPIKNMLARAA